LPGDDADTEEDDVRGIWGNDCEGLHSLENSDCSCSIRFSDGNRLLVEEPRLFSSLGIAINSGSSLSSFSSSSFSSTGAPSVRLSESTLGEDDKLGGLEERKGILDDDEDEDEETGAHALLGGDGGAGVIDDEILDDDDADADEPELTGIQPPRDKGARDWGTQESTANSGIVSSRNTSPVLLSFNPGNWDSSKMTSRLKNILRDSIS
jgi:hypothetical protein